MHAGLSYSRYWPKSQVIERRETFQRDVYILEVHGLMVGMEAAIVLVGG